MMLSFGDELRDRVTRLLDDVGALNLVSGVGFVAGDDAILAQNKQHLAEGPWRFVELSPEPGAARRALIDVWDEARVVLMLPPRLPRPLVEMVRACVDHRPAVDLGDFQKRERRTDQSLVLVVNGVSDAESIPAELREVPCWELLP